MDDYAWMYSGWKQGGGLDLGMDSEDRGFLGSSIFKG